MPSNRLNDLAWDVHGILAVIAFTDKKINLVESKKYFAEKYGLVPLCNSKGLLIGIRYTEKDRIFKKQISNLKFYRSTIVPLSILLTLQPEEEDIKETAEELFQQVNDYLNSL